MSLLAPGHAGHLPRVTAADPGPWQRRLHVEHVWGTVVAVDVRGDDVPRLEYDAALAESIAFLHQVDAWFSTYRADSTITALRNGLLPAYRMPIPVQQVLEACEHARALTGGAFDPWAVRGGVDPSGYVKGWAAQRVAEHFVEAGLGNVAVDASGDVACRGEQAPGEPWSVGVLDPYDPRQVVAVVRVRDGAVATSGLYARGPHIDNPHTGGTSVWYDSATIVGDDAGLADALATGALVEGPSCAAWFAELPGWSAYLVKDGVAQHLGPAFADR